MKWLTFCLIKYFDFFLKNWCQFLKCRSDDLQVVDVFWKKIFLMFLFSMSTISSHFFWRRVPRSFFAALSFSWACLLCSVRLNRCSSTTFWCCAALHWIEASYFLEDVCFVEIGIICLNLSWCVVDDETLTSCLRMAPVTNQINLLLIAICLIFTNNVHANVDCITVRSDKSLTKDDARTYAACPSSHSTLVSCGATTVNSAASSFDGASISTTAIPARCYAQNAQRGSGVYAYARCCNFVSTDIDCKYSISSSYSSGADDAVRTTQCGTNTHNTMLGCSVYTEWASLDGSYPGYPEVRPDTITQYDTHNYPAYSQCSAVNGANNNNGVKANLACCHSPTYDLQCITRYGTPANQLSVVSCPSGYFMSGCSAWSKHRVNGWFIQENTCYARSQPNIKVYSSAIWYVSSTWNKLICFRVVYIVVA